MHPPQNEVIGYAPWPNSLWEALSVVSQWIPFPALIHSDQDPERRVEDSSAAWGDESLPPPGRTECVMNPFGCVESQGFVGSPIWVCE